MENICTTKIEVKIPSEWKQKLEQKAATEHGCITTAEALRCAIRHFIGEA